MKYRTIFYLDHLATQDNLDMMDAQANRAFLLTTWSPVFGYFQLPWDSLDWHPITISSITVDETQLLED